MTRAHKRLRRTAAAFVVLIIIFGLALYAFCIRPWDSGVVASLETPDGSRYMVVQTYQTWSEPYDVKLFSQMKGDEWRASYLAHESGSWRDASFDYHPEIGQIRVMEGGVEYYVVDRSKTPVIGMPEVPRFPFPES